MLQRNFFLDEIGRSLHKSRPKLPQGFDTSRHIEQMGDKSFVNIRVRSRGCKHNYLGGCTMCDYWISSNVDVKQMISYAKTELESLDFIPTLLMLGPSGSMFDDWEVPQIARREFYRMMREIDASTYVLFSRVDTITLEKLAEVVEYLKPSSRISIEMGLETADPWKLHFCINKAMDIEQFVQAVQMIKFIGANSTAYVLAGAPFLSLAEAVEDTVASVMWALKQDVGYCVIFPVHIKPWTVIYWLYQHNMYQPVSLWFLVEVLARFPPELLKYIGISWHTPRPDRVHPLYQIPDIPPTTCSVCYSQVIDLLDSYRFSQDRASVVQALNSIKCNCRDSWLHELNNITDTPLDERVKNIYTQMGIDVLGKHWWEANGQSVLAGITSYESRTIS